MGIAEAKNRDFDDGIGESEQVFADAFAFVSENERNWKLEIRNWNFMIRDALVRLFESYDLVAMFLETLDKQHGVCDMFPGLVRDGVDGGFGDAAGMAIALSGIAGVAGKI